MAKTPTHLGARIVAGTAGGSLAIAGLVWLARIAGNESLAKGLITGGSIGIAVTVTLLLLARRSQAPAEARIVAGLADERERRIEVTSLAYAGVAMYAVAIVATMLGAFIEIPLAAALFAVMVTGLATAATHFAIAVRRG